MKDFLVISLFLFSATIQAQLDDQNRVTSIVDSSAAPDVVLTQSFIVDTPLELVWDAYTTGEGWEMWAAPLAQVNLTIGGKIRTNYNPNASLEDSTTNTLTIVNYVPLKLLTLQADVTKNWPVFMQKDHKRLFNVIVFEEINERQTKVISYGIGYTTDPDYMELMNYFIPANEGLLNKLITVLEIK